MKLLTKNSGLYGKITIAVVFVLIAGLIHFLQASGWHRAIAQDYKLTDILILFMGYILLAFGAPLVFALHKKLPFERDSLVRIFSFHLVVSLLFSIVHNLAFSGIYYIIFPAWKDFGFSLLFKDVFYNYFNIGILFYWAAVAFSEAYDAMLSKHNAHAQTKIYLDRLTVKDNKTTHLVSVADISHIRSADNYAEIHGGPKTLLMRQSLASLEKQLDPDTFLRIHRTAIVNRQMISQINRTSTGELQLTLRDGCTLPMSRHRKEVKQLLLANPQH